ncbi:MAG: hypothetical protein JWO54_779 [Candidatus Saccharibacteria bacterium]|nr:hypothetical protein [Candidatus Saccharibacteria bacterium]
MKKIITLICLIMSALLILDSIHFSHALMMFYLAGIIPGTNTVIEASQMLEIFALVSGFTFARIISYIAKSFILELTATSQVQS